MANEKLSEAKKAKYDEFYTQYRDIETEMSAYLDYNPEVFKGKTILLPCDDPEWSNFTKYFAQNFEKLGLKKIISTSFASESKTYKEFYQPTLFETSQPQFDQKKTNIKGKIFTLTKDQNDDQTIDIDDLEWQYLESDGDFRSAEVKKLRDEADIIITNPPFSLFTEFLAWIMEAEKEFVIIGNKNCVTYKEVFPLFMSNKIWSGRTGWSGGMWFETVSEDYVDRVIDGVNMKNIPSIWLTNIDHGKRHKPIPLMSYEDNLKYSNHKEIKGKTAYDKYDNYDAIEVPFTDSIPSDYEGMMGVPISFLDKYSPDQFEILGMCENLDLYGLKTKKYTTTECQDAYFALFKKKGTYDLNASGVLNVNGRLEKVYQRILIRHKKAEAK